MKGRLFSVLYMFVLSLVFTSVVSALNVLNKDRIRQNEALRLQGLVLTVLNIGPSEKGSAAELAQLFSRRVREASLGDRPLYVGLAEDGKTVVGYAFPVSGPGFWGPIEAMVAVAPDIQKVLGIAFYRHSETPGLGGRITEAWFQNQFQGRPLQVPPAGMRFFYLKPPGTAHGPTELDAITGATETSRRLEKFLDEELKKTIPLLLDQKARSRV
ncbi:MAG: FMN-binding protein [Desulfosoma sp.]